LPAPCKPFFCNRRAILLKKSDALSCCYSRYSADDAGRRTTADDSCHLGDVMEPAPVISYRIPVVVRVPYFTHG